ncbi:hypothetical protein AB1K83_17305 [Sporosarcina sp. 179-K 3D1 HS]|uniref:hypothetical protein n=1 Tax=Sporosarcina sp. 179-K 3D1 HS TaxID=3232169 RepID=UPI0039A0B8FF
MKGQHIVIGLIVLVLAVVAVLYLTMTATFKKDENGMESTVLIEEMVITKAHADQG